MNATATQKRMVVSGTFGQRYKFDVDPAFGSNDEWRVLVANSIDATPVQRCDFVSPRTMGELDALDGAPISADQYDKEGERAEYFEGYYKAITELCLRNASKPVSEAHVMTFSECLAETSDYADDMQDREWWGRGGW